MISGQARWRMVMLKDDGNEEDDMTTPRPRHDGGQVHAHEVEVLLLGGPPDWHGKILSMPASVTERESAGAHLVSAHTPHRDPEVEDIDPRAVYGPDPVGDQRV